MGGRVCFDYENARRAIDRVPPGRRPQKCEVRKGLAMSKGQWAFGLFFRRDPRFAQRAAIEGGVSIFAVSTYDTDYLLVKEKDLERTIFVLNREGHIVEQ